MNKMLYLCLSLCIAMLVLCCLMLVRVACAESTTVSMNESEAGKYQQANFGKHQIYRYKNPKMATLEVSYETGTYRNGEWIPSKNDRNEE